MPININLKDTEEVRDLLIRMGKGDEEAIAFFKQHITEVVKENMDAFLASWSRQSTGHKDFFDKELFVGDVVALMEKRAHSVYLRKGTVIGRTDKMVKVKYVPQGVNFEEETVKTPYNLIKA